MTRSASAIWGSALTGAQESIMTTLSQHIGNFIYSLDMRRIPAEVAEKARVCLLNAYGMGLDCHRTPYAPVARAAELAMDGEQPRGPTTLGDGRKTSIE